MGVGKVKLQHYHIIVNVHSSRRNFRFLTHNNGQEASSDSLKDTFKWNLFTFVGTRVLDPGGDKYDVLSTR